MTSLALIVASWILVSLVATLAFCLLATAVKRGSPAQQVALEPEVSVGCRGAVAPVVALPAQRRPAPSPVLTA